MSGNVTMNRIVLAIAVALPVVGCGKEEPKKVEVRPVRVTSVRHTPSGETISLTGRIQAKDQAKQQLKTAQSQVETAQARLQNAKDNLTYTELKSDVAGSVTAKGAEPGEVVAAGRMVLQVARQGGRDVVFNVPSQLIRQ